MIMRVSFCELQKKGKIIISQEILKSYATVTVHYGNIYLLSSAFYLCKECSFVFCKLPNYCRYCHSNLLNDIHYSMIKQPENIEPLCPRYLKITKLYNDYNLSAKVPDREVYLSFLAKYKDQIRQYYMMRQRSSDIDLSDGITLTLIHTIKSIILFRKYNRGNFLRSNIEKNLNYMNEDDFISKNQYFCLKENFICNGCDIFLNKSQTKDLSNFDIFYICEVCAEIYCV
jgi:hypothetical protein